jgi:NADH-quinone oxidoreductase E subunit
MSNVQANGFEFTQESMAAVKAQLAKYPEDRKQSAIIALLDIAQRQLGGSLNYPAMEYVGEMLGMPYMKVLEVASFYTMLNLQPVGRHHVQVCTTTPCWLRGSDEVLGACKKKLNIEPGEITQDGQFSLIEVECLGACVNAPMVQINDDYYEDLDGNRMTQILDDLEGGREVTPGPQVNRQTTAPISGAKTCLTDKK